MLSLYFLNGTSNLYKHFPSITKYNITDVKGRLIEYNSENLTFYEFSIANPLSYIHTTHTTHSEFPCTFIRFSCYSKQSNLGLINTLVYLLLENVYVCNIPHFYYGLLTRMHIDEQIDFYRL